MNRIGILLALALSTIFSISNVHAIILDNTIPFKGIIITSQTYIDSYFNWTFAEINSTHWWANFTINQTLWNDAKKCINNLLNNSCWNELKQNYFSDFNIAKLKIDLLNMSNYPRINRSLDISFDKFSFDLTNGKGSQFLIFPNGFKEGLEAVLGFGSTVLETSTDGDALSASGTSKRIAFDGTNWWFFYRAAVSDLRIFSSSDLATWTQRNEPGEGGTRSGGWCCDMRIKTIGTEKVIIAGTGTESGTTIYEWSRGNISGTTIGWTDNRSVSGLIASNGNRVEFNSAQNNSWDIGWFTGASNSAVRSNYSMATPYSNTSGYFTKTVTNEGNNNPMLVPLSGDNMQMFWSANGAGTLKVINFTNSTEAWSSSVTIATNLDTGNSRGTGVGDEYSAVSYRTNGTWYTDIVAINSSGGIDHYRETNGSTSFTRYDVNRSGVADNGISITYNETTGELWAFWITTDETIAMKQWDGVSWVNQTLINTSTSQKRNIGSSVSVGANNIGIYWLDGSASPFQITIEKVAVTTRAGAVSGVSTSANLTQSFSFTSSTPSLPFIRKRLPTQSTDITESKSILQSLKKSQTNPITLSNPVSRIRSLPRNLINIITFGNEPNFFMIRSRTIIQPLDLTEIISISISRIRLILQSLDLSEAVQRIQKLTRLFTNGMSLIDRITTSVTVSGGAITRSITEALSFTGKIIPLQKLTRSFIQGLDLSEIANRFVSLPRNLLQPFSLTGQISKFTINVRSILQSLSITNLNQRLLSLIRIFTNPILFIVSGLRIIAEKIAEVGTQQGGAPFQGFVTLIPEIIKPIKVNLIPLLITIGAIIALYLRKEIIKTRIFFPFYRRKT